MHVAKVGLEDIRQVFEFEPHLHFEIMLD
jgi:hypothetical protein